MFGRVRQFFFGGSIDDLKRAGTFATMRQQLLSIVQKAVGYDNKRWDGPGVSIPLKTSIEPGQLVPYARNIITTKLANAADTDRDICKQLVGAMVINDVPSEDMNLYLLMVIETIESQLGRQSKSVREMASAVGTMTHEKNMFQHMSNHRWNEAETELRLCLEMEHLKPTGHQVVTMIRLADMVRLQDRYEEAGQLFKEAFRLYDKLDPNIEFYDLALNIINTVKPQIGDYLK